MTGPLEYLVIGCYLLALGGYWARLIWGTPEWMHRTAKFVVRFGVGLQAVLLVQRWLESGMFPAVGYREMLAFLSFAIVSVLVVIESRHEVPILGAFVLPVAVLAVIRLPMISRTLEAVPPKLVSHWLPLHVVSSFTSYALFIAAFGVGVAYLVQERQLKARRVGRVLHELPPLEVLDGLGFRLIGWGTALLAIGLAVGMLWTRQATGGWFRGDPKEWWVVGTLLLYSGYLAIRLAWGWRGRSAVYLSLIGFGVLLIAFIGVNVVGRHPHYF